MLEHELGVAAELRRCRVRGEEPRQILAQHEREWCGTIGRSCAPRAGRIVLVRRGVGAEPSPRDGSREAELLQVVRVVAGDPRGKYVGLPRARGELDALELAHHLEQPLAAMEVRARLYVLPAEEEAHEIGRRH